MPNIDDLKNSKPSGFVPSLKQLNQNEEPSLPPHMSAGITQGQSSVSNRVYTGNKRGTAVRPEGNGGMSFAKKPEREGRVEADFSDLPKENPAKANIPGVEIHESIEDDIFKKGGPFDQYLEEKMEEYREDMEKYDAAIEAKQLEDEEKAEEAANPDNEVISELQTADSEDVETNISKAASYRNISLKRREKPMEEKKVKEEELQEEKAPKNNQYYYDDSDEDIHDDYDAEDEDDDYEEPDEEEDEDTDEDDDDVYTEDLEYEDDQRYQPLKTRVKVEEYPDATEKIEDSVESEPAKVDETGTVKSNAPIAAKVAKVARTYMAIEEVETPNKDNPDEENINVEVSDDDDQLNILKALISEKIKPVTKKLNLDGFTIARKGTTANNILQTESAAVAKWILPNTGIVIQMREISGANMELIRSNLDRRPAPNIRGALKIIYDHIVSPKPDQFETWLKSVAYSDYDNLFMAAYIASFSEANYLPIDCTNESCGKAYLSDNIDIMSMVKFNDKESENKFWDLYNSDAVNGNGLYVSKVTPISDKFAVAFKEPSLYDTMIESGYFNEDFTSKYANIIAYLPYIDEIYYIDEVNRSLVPIDYKRYENNISRTARSKVVRYNKIFNTLNADQNSIITAHVNAINERDNWFTYQIPETTCPECGFVNPASDSPQTASSLLFLRNRLAVLVTI